MRVWSEGVAGLRVAVIRYNPATWADEAWDISASAFAPLNMGQLAPSQMWVMQCWGPAYSGHHIQWADIRDEALVCDAAVVFLLTESHGYVSDIIELRAIYQMLPAIVV